METNLSLLSRWLWFVLLHWVYL